MRTSPKQSVVGRVALVRSLWRSLELSGCPGYALGAVPRAALSGIDSGCGCDISAGYLSVGKHLTIGAFLNRLYQTMNK